MMIGALLIFVAVIMVKESKGLLVGESAHADIVKGVYELINNEVAVSTTYYPLTMHLAPEEILLAIDVQFDTEMTMEQLIENINQLEVKIKEKYPSIKKIYIEAKNLKGKKVTGL